LLRNGKISGFASIQASDQLASAAGCLGKILSESKVGVHQIEAVATTGGGSRYIGKKLLGIPVRKVDEIKALGLGGMVLAKKKRCFIVSIGTGTAMVMVEDGGKRIKHVCGTGVGGGTLKGLFRLLLNKHDIENLEIMAKKGDLAKINLTVKDIVGKGIGKLSAKATAANFGKIVDDITHSDIALGIINLVAEVIGTISTFAARVYGLEKDIVFIGKVTKNKTLMKRIEEVVRTFDGKCVVPKRAEFATAIGAARALQMSEKASLIERIKKRVPSKSARKKNHRKKSR
jgi:type II pantothenate kinase